MKGLSALVLAGPKKKESEEDSDSYEPGYENAFSESGKAFMDALKGGDDEVALKELKGAIEACVSEYQDGED